MPNENTKIPLIISLIIAAIAVMGFILYAGTHTQSTTKVGGGFVVSAFDSNQDSGATTTVQYLQSNQAASTTISRYTAMAESIDLNMQYTASTTSGCLQWQYAFSNNALDWYYENGRSIVSNTAETDGATPLLHTWCPVSNATVRKNISISPTASKYLRVEFMPTVANGSLYEQLVLKNIIQN